MTHAEIAAITAYFLCRNARRASCDSAWREVPKISQRHRHHSFCTLLAARVECSRSHAPMGPGRAVSRQAISSTMGPSHRSYSQQVDVGNSTLTTVNGLSNSTTYYFAVRAYDATGAISDASNEIFAAIAPGVPPIVTTLALTANVPSPQVIGTTVAWLSTATGGVAPYQFQWTLVGGYYDSPPLVNRLDVVVDTCDHGQLPGTSGRTECGQQQHRRRNGPVGAIYRDGPCSSNCDNTRADRTTFLRHRYWVIPSVGWQPRRAASHRINSSGHSSVDYDSPPWSTASTWSWTPVTTGNYQVRVAVRSAGSSSTVGEMVRSVPFVVTAGVASVTLQPSLPAPQKVGTTILWSAAASGGGLTLPGTGGGCSMAACGVRCQGGQRIQRGPGGQHRPNLATSFGSGCGHLGAPSMRPRRLLPFRSRSDPRATVGIPHARSVSALIRRFSYTLPPHCAPRRRG